MIPERWEKLADLHRRALERPEDERAEFLARACAGDDELRQEVESLLAQPESGFLEKSALEALAAGLTRQAETGGETLQGPSMTGGTIAHYQVLERLGAGGMGEVYRARDTKLQRDVALKILPQALAHDAQRMARFKREAQVLASLNHPNIAAIHGLEESKGIRALVMELVEGQTLAERISVAPVSLLPARSGDPAKAGTGSTRAGHRSLMSTEEALPIFRQIAEALEYAHERGVIHRDLKPANVKVTPEGTVKVLDFGLAKVMSPQDSSATMDMVKSPTLTDMATKAGMILGTAAYMSPEQAKGQRVDRRCDIWAFGCVLYEMLTGRKPFEGETITDVLASVIRAEPDWNALPATTPPSIQRLIRRCLQKDQRQRLRDIGEARITIEETLAARGAIYGSSLPPIPGGETSTPGLHDASDSQLVAALVKRHRGKVAVLAGFIAAVLVVGGYFGYRELRPREARQQAGPPTAPANMQITQLTTSGTVQLAAISPDGRYVAYVEQDPKGPSLWLRQVATGSNVQIIPPAAGVGYGGMTFTPDGNYLDYVVAQHVALPPDLYRVPVLGGQSTKLLADVNSAVTFSPGGKRIAFLRYRGRKSGPQLVTANADGSGEKVLEIKALPSTDLSGFYHGLAWSPEGSVIATSALTYEPTDQIHPVAIDVSTGEEKNIGPERWFTTRRLTWLPGGKSLLMIASDFSTPIRFQIWKVSYPDGKARRVTNDLNSYAGVSVTADGSALATVKTQTASNIWVAPKGDWDHPQQLTEGLSNADGTWGVSWTGDGKIVYTSAANGNQSLWQLHPGNGQPRRLVQTQLPDVFPSVCGGSPGYITFVKGTQKNNPVIWRVNPDSSHLKQLTDARDWFPSCSPDGKWVVYTSISPGPAELWKVSTDGGKPVQLTHAAGAAYPSISPDGKWIACVYKADPKSPWVVAILPFAGGKPVKTFQLVPNPSVLGYEAINWMPNGREVAYGVQKGGVSNIVEQPIDGGAPKQLTHYDSGHVFNFAISRSGQLALARGTDSSDVVLIRNFR